MTEESEGSVQRRHDYAAEGELRRAVRLRPRDSAGHRRLAAWLLRAGRPAQAREALVAGLATADRPDSLEHLLGLILAGLGGAEAAERHLGAAAARHPARADYLRNLGLAQGAVGRLETSVETLRKARDLAPNAGGALEWVIGLGERALRDRGERPVRRAPGTTRDATVIEALVSDDPDLAEAFVPRKGLAAESQASRERLLGVRRALKRILAEHPEYPDVHLGLGLVAERLGQIERALASAERALELNPRYAEAAILAVRLYERAAEPARALERCRTVTEVRPEWAEGHLRLGALLAAEGDGKGAAACYRRALEVAPECAAARDGLAAVGAEAEGGDA